MSNPHLDKPRVRYVIVEHSGMIGERDCKSFASYTEASKYLNARYEQDDTGRFELDTDICQIAPDGSRSYDF